MESNGRFDIDRELSLRVGLEQYRSLTDEITLRLKAESRLCYLALAGTAVIYSLVLGQKASPLLYLVVPPISVILALQWVVQIRMISLIAQFIREDLWPDLTLLAGHPIPSWEGFWSAARPNQPIHAAPVLVFMAPVLISLALAFSAVAGSPLLYWTWIADGCFCLVTAALAARHYATQIRPAWDRPSEERT